MPTLLLQGPRLRLRPWRFADLATALVWNNDLISLRWGDAERRDDPYCPWASAEIEHVYRVVSSRGYAFVALLGRQRVGEFILTYNGPQPLTGRIDLVVAPAFRRRGLGREGVAICSEFAFRSLGLKRLNAYVDPDNIASNGLFRSLGFRRSKQADEQPFVLSRTAPALARLSAVLI